MNLFRRLAFLGFFFWVAYCAPGFFPDNSPLLSRTENRHKKTNHKGWFFWEFLVGTRGFEPPTPDTP